MPQRIWPGLCDVLSIKLRMPLRVSEFEALEKHLSKIRISTLFFSKVQRNNDDKELLKDINENYKLVRSGLREILKTVYSLKAYAVNNVEINGAEVVLIPVLHTLNDIEVELKVLVGRRLVLFLNNIMG